MIMALTVQQAEREARWRWGGLFARGFARFSGATRLGFEVGTKRFGKILVRGQGTSWESAFANADNLTNGDVERPRKQSGGAVLRPERSRK
jgi:hypothetical protein